MKLLCIGTFTIVALLIMSACGGGVKTKKITGTSGKVTEVIDGNTIKLSNNLTVNLLGVEDNLNTKKFLENNIKGKRVKLIADSKDSKKTYVVGNKETVNAYVVVPGDRTLNSVNGRMVRTEVSAFVRKNVSDSTFNIDKEIEHELTDAELLTLLKPRTFLILHSDGSLGTGFYISSSGIALTNAHVLNYNNIGSSKVVPFKDDGSFDVTNYRSIERILKCGSDEYTQTDYCIFEVSLNGQEVPFLKLATKPELDGNRVWKLGCVSGEPAAFSGGNVSHTIDGVVSHSSKINQGDSGSPLVNKFGRVIGINQSIKVNPNIGGDVGVYYAVDIQILRDWFEKNRDNKGQLYYGR